MNRIRIFFLLLKIKLDERLHAHFAKRLKTAEENYEHSLNNKASEIKKKINSLKLKKIEKCANIEAKLLEDSKEEFDSEYSEIKKESFSESSHLENNLKDAKALLNRDREDLESTLKKKDTYVAELNRSYSLGQNVMPNEEYNSLVRQRYVLTGKLQKAQNYRTYRLPKDQYYALKNKISQIDSVIENAQRALKHKQNVPKLNERISQCNAHISFLERDIREQENIVGRVKTSFENKYAEEFEKWETSKKDIASRLKTKIDEKCARKIKSENEKISSEFEEKIKLVPVEVQNKINALKIKVDSLKNKTGDYFRKIRETKANIEKLKNA